MNTTNAFIGRKEAPTSAELAATLGPAQMPWNELIAWMEGTLHVEEREWKGVVAAKYGWSLRLKQKDRNIVYLSPCTGCFRVGFVMGDGAMAEVKAASFPARAAKAIAAGVKYPEGTGITLFVEKREDLASVERLAAIKVAGGPQPRRAKAWRAEKGKGASRARAFAAMMLF